MLRPQMPEHPTLAPTLAAEDAAIAHAIVNGLSQAQKTLPTSLFYDDEGSRLFQRIMALPEYYLTRVEHGILQQRGAELAAWVAPGPQPVELIELGSGDGEKTLTLCQALVQRPVPCTYRPLDISPLALADLARRFRQHLPQLPLQPVAGDYFDTWPELSAAHRQVVLYMGSNLGNLNHEQAVVLLRRVRERLRPGDALLLGLDLMKDPLVVLAAYADSAGVTAEFNLNLLTRLNREWGFDFDHSAFSHYACYSPLDGAARSFLVSRRAQAVHSRALGQAFQFAEGETIYTEQSQKYSPALIQALAHDSGFEVKADFRDERGWYSVVAWEAVG